MRRLHRLALAASLLVSGDGAARADVASRIIELESLAPATAGAGMVQPMAGFGAGWGGDAQLFWPATAPTGDGPRLTVPFEPPRAGSFELVLFHTVAPDYGRFTVLIDGRPTGDVDGWAPRVALGRAVLGRHQLAAGRHHLTFLVTGKAAASTGHFVGVDRLELTAAAPSDERSTLAEPARPVRVRTPPPEARGGPLTVPPELLRELQPAAGPPPSLRIVGYRPVRPYARDFLCWLVATRDGPVQAGTNPPRLAYRKGERRYICNPSSGSALKEFADRLVEAVGQFAGSLGAVVDGVSAAYGQIKSGVVDVVAGAFAQVGCGDPCRLAVELALDAALTSVGVPPSLPDFDQVVADLEKQGIDAVTKTIAEAAVSQGLPGPLAEEAANQAVTHLVEQAKKAAATGAKGGSSQAPSDWKPDPGLAYRPGALLLELTNASDGPSAEIVLGLVHENPKKLSVPEIPRLDGWLPETVEVGGLRPQFRRVPPLAPGGSLRVELTLVPVPDPHGWLDLYREAPVKITQKRNAACGASPPPSTCWGADDDSEGCKKRRQWDECTRFWTEKFFAVNSSALRLRDAFLDVYANPEDRFSLKLLPGKGEMSIHTSGGVAQLGPVH